MIKYIPEDYVNRKNSRFTFHFNSAEPAGTAESMEGCICRSLDVFKNWLGSDLATDMHFCMFHCLEDSRPVFPALQSATELCVPFMAGGQALVTFFSPAAHKLNGDAERMQRHFIHELVHVFISELAGSCKCLGAGEKVNYPVGEGLEEGIAELVSLYLAGRHDQLEKCRDFYQSGSRSEMKSGEAGFYSWWTGKASVLTGDVCGENVEAVLKKALSS